jgi:hypothetical protein
MGVPGQVVRSLTGADLERTRRICAHYQEMARSQAAGNFSPPWEKT